MNGGHLQDRVKTVRCANAAAAGVTAVNGSSVDMAASPGANSVRFLALLGALTATQVTTLKAQSSPDNSTWTDIPNAVTAGAADGDSNKLLTLDVKNPPARYVRPVLGRGTANAVLDGIIAEVYDCRAVPVTQDSTVSQAAKV